MKHLALEVEHITLSFNSPVESFLVLKELTGKVPKWLAKLTFASEKGEIQHFWYEVNVG